MLNTFTFYLYSDDDLGGIHEWGIPYGGNMSMPDITELELGPSENSYSRAR